MSEFMKIRYDLLTPNPYSRPQYKLEEVRGIVIHYVANPMSRDIDNRNFFNNRKYGNDGYGSAHEIIDLDGSIVICIPDNEIAYHVGANSYMDGIFKKLNTTYPNSALYGIEFTHPDWTGKPNDITYQALVIRTANLCNKYNLNPLEDLYRHYDITGKNCPKYYVNNPDEWNKFKQEVSDYMANNSLEKWKVEMGVEALRELALELELDDPQMHIDNFNNGENIDWLLLVMMNKINNKIDSLKIVSE